MKNGISQAKGREHGHNSEIKLSHKINESEDAA